MPAACIIRPQHELLRPQVNDTSIVKDTLKSAPRKEHRNVHFKCTVTVRHIRHLNNICAQEIRNVWYSMRDFDRIKREITVTVKMISAKALNDDNEDQYCARGVEHRTYKGAKRRKANKMNVLWAVLDEQNRQRSYGIFNDELIRLSCIDRNRICRLTALEKGVEDQCVARALDVDDDDSDDDCSLADEMEYYNFRSDMRDEQFRLLFNSLME